MNDAEFERQSDTPELLMNSTYNSSIGVGNRLLTMLLDHVFMTIIAVLFFVPTMFSGIGDLFEVSHKPTNLNLVEGPGEYLGLVGFALYFCKDIINGRSIAKRILKFQVVDNSSGRVASPLQCFVRNVFCIIWPVELIVAMTNTSRRLGDRVAGTKLVIYDPSLEQPKINIGKIIIPFVLSYGLILLIDRSLPSVQMTEIGYSETSYNKLESQELEQVFTDSLGQYLVPDIRVYDTAKNHGLRYVSTILKLKENYIEDDNTYKELHETATSLIYSKIPKETFTGQIRYVYKRPGQFQSRATNIGSIGK